MKTVSIVPDGTLAYGIQLPVQALSVRTSAPWEREHSTIDDMVRVAQACDDAGFLYVAVCHHVAVPREPAEMMSTQWFDPVPTLAYLAAQTTRTRLMTNVYVVAYNHPLQTAKAFATLDALSGGRVILGVGAGHVEGEFDALGVPFNDRGRITDEAIDAIANALEHEWPDHAGDRWKFADVGQRPRPVQTPRPPIWVGGSGKPALRRVAARGDGWIPQGTPRTQLPDDIAYILRHRDDVRPGAVPEVGYITEYVYVGEPGWEIPKYSVSGSPQKLVDNFNTLGEMGVSHLQLRFASRSAPELCDQIAAFGADVGRHLVRRALT
ncbi:MAG TPA: TIGR03619 family F420-dependent LLM class oxidoreductase [Acidimicrobiia bacterium]|nr:TIGR03619 family F420-dependent LLM class oxidoreductase [Acidimicrobiia bacterium]